MGRWRLWIYLPRLELRWRRTIRAKISIRTGARYICNVIIESWEMAIVIFRVVTYSLTRLDHVFVAEIETFLQRLKQGRKLSSNCGIH